MRSFSLVVLIQFLILPQLLAEMGRAPYAIQNTSYDCNGLTTSVTEKGNFKYSWLYNTFNNSGGDGLQCVKKLNSLPNTVFMEVHLINEVCQRNNNCGPYEILHGLSLKDLRKGLKTKNFSLITKLEAYIKKSSEEILPTLNERITCAISPSLESNLDQESAKVLLDLTRKYYAPRCKLVSNPVNNNKFGTKPIPDTIHELHGNKPKLKAPCIANLDGIDIALSSRKSFHKLGAITEQEAKKYLKNYSHCEAAFLWIAEDNCLAPGNFIDPRERKNCTTRAQQLELQVIFK
jgi:hypothetical protein